MNKYVGLVVSQQYKNQTFFNCVVGIYIFNTLFKSFITT